jgi:hypothetical protein
VDHFDKCVLHVLREDPSNNGTTSQMWTRIAAQLNSSGYAQCVRTEREVRKKWQNTLDAARREQTQAHNHLDALSEHTLNILQIGGLVRSVC